jgi:hypothetical protein
MKGSQGCAEGICLLACAVLGGLEIKKRSGKVQPEERVFMVSLELRLWPMES